MAGEIQLNSVTLATESGGVVSLDADVALPYASQSEVFGTHTTGTITSGTTSLTVASGTGISNGDYVTGEGIAPGTTVSSGGGTTSITLSANAGATLSSDPVSFYKANKVLSPGLVAGALCRAWVNFNGAGSIVLNSSYNVSSVTYVTTGQYTVNFTTAMPDSKYCGVASAGYDSGASGSGTFAISAGNTHTTTQFKIVTARADTAATANAQDVSIAFFR